jgi:hypothetical protein
MANPLDQFLKDQTALRSPKKDVPLMLDESILPRGEVTYNPQNKAAGIPIKGATLNAQGKVTAPIQGIGVQGNKPIEQSKVEELKQIFKPAPVMPEPVAPTPTPTPEVPTKEEPKKEQGFDWKSLLPALAPLAVEGIMGTQAGGTAGEGAGIAAKYILDEEAKKEARKKEFENKIIAMQQARDLASIKASGKQQKELTTSNVLPIVGEDGKVRYEMVKEAVGQEKPTETPKGMTFEQRAWLQSQGQKYGLSKEARKEQVAAGARFQQRLDSDKEYQGLKSQITNSEKAIEYLSQGVNIADVGIKRVFAKGIFGDVGNLAVQEQADIAGSPDLYSRYMTLKAKFEQGLQFSDKDRAQLMDFALMIRNNAPKKLDSVVKNRVLAEQGISGQDVSKVAASLYSSPYSNEPMVKVVYKGKIKPVPASKFSEAIGLGASLYTGKK